ELIEKELRSINKSRRLPGGVVLVGGVSKIPGIAEFAKEKLQLAARTGNLQPIGGIVDTVKDRSYTTAVGLMLLDMYLLPSNAASSHTSGANDRVFGALSELWGRAKRRVRS